MLGKLRKVSAAVCGIAVVAATITVTAPAANAAPVAPTSVENIVNDSNQQTVIDVFNGINAFRASKGLSKLTFSVPISAVSQKWSNTMAAEDHFRHNPDFVTGTPEGRLLTSEIIAARWDRSGQGLVNQWIDSPEHNAIMSNPEMTTMGIGVAYTDGTPDLVALRYATYGTANLFKYNGTPENTFSSPADYFAGAQPLPLNLFSVTPAAPTFAETTYTIPAVTGVKYEVNGVEQKDGTYPVTVTNVNVRASVLYGYYFPANTMSNWGATYTLPEIKTATVPDPTFNVAKSTVQLHHVFGVEYTVNDKVLPAGSYYIPSVVNVTVKATAGYVLDPSRPTTWSRDLTPIPVTQPALIATPHAPQFNIDAGTYVIPNSDGIVYTVNGVVTAPGEYPATGVVSVTASAAADYVLATGVETSWTVDFTGQAAAADTAVTPAAPTTTVGKYTIPLSEGVYYMVNGAEKIGGTYSASGKVGITAHALEGYVLNGTTSWTLNMMNTPLVRAGDMLAVDSKGALWNYGNRAATGRKLLFASGYLPAKKVFATDWNSDGVTDIVAQWKAGNLSVAYGSNAGTFSATKVIGTGWGSFDVHVGKYKRTDKYPSILAKDSVGNLWNYLNLYGTGTNGRVLKGTGWKALQVNLIDWDKDGGVDILAKTSVGKILLYRTDGYGKFKSEARKAIGSGWASFQMRTINNYAGAGTQGVLAKDSSGRLYYYGTGRSAWTPRVYKGAGWTPMNIAG